MPGVSTIWINNIKLNEGHTFLLHDFNDQVTSGWFLSSESAQIEIPSWFVKFLPDSAEKDVTITTALWNLSDRKNRSGCFTGAALTQKLEQHTQGRRAAGTHNKSLQQIWNGHFDRRQIKIGAFHDTRLLLDAFSWATFQEHKLCVLPQWESKP